MAAMTSPKFLTLVAVLNLCCSKSLPIMLFNIMTWNGSKTITSGTCFMTSWKIFVTRVYSGAARPVTRGAPGGCGRPRNCRCWRNHFYPGPVFSIPRPSPRNTLFPLFKKFPKIITTQHNDEAHWLKSRA